MVADEGNPVSSQDSIDNKDKRRILVGPSYERAQRAAHVRVAREPQKMPDPRPAIPMDLERRILVEAGHKCAVPTCKQTPVEIAHIVPWSQVKRHEFDNLIALCPNCHTRYDRGDIDRKSMQIYKMQLCAGTDIRKELDQRVERLEAEAKTPRVEAPRGFAVAVSVYHNRACGIGIVDGPRFITVGTCTFVRPRLAIVPGKVVEMIADVLKVRGDHAGVWEPSGISKFREVRSPRTHGDLRLIEVNQVPDSAWQFLNKEYSEVEAESMRSAFSVNESPIRANLEVYIGDHVGFLTAPENTNEFRGAMEFQFQDAYVSFRGSSLNSGIHSGYLTPIPSALNHPGAPLFRSDGTLLALLTDMVFLDAETGGRPVFTTLLSLPELWEPHSKGEGQ